MCAVLNASLRRFEPYAAFSHNHSSSTAMPKTLKRNTLIVFGLAIVFWWSFMFAKHDPHLRSIIPFGSDPYDAVGSFGIIVGMLIALLSVVRAFRPYPKQAPTMAQCV